MEQYEIYQETPRDDRFYTPRAFSQGTSSNSDGEFFTPRVPAGGASSHLQDGEYQTPRSARSNNSDDMRGRRSSGSFGAYASPRMDNGSHKQYNTANNQNSQYGSHYNSGQQQYYNGNQQQQSSSQYNNSQYNSSQSSDGQYGNYNYSSGQYDSNYYGEEKENVFSVEEGHLDLESEEVETDIRDIDDLFRATRHGRCEDIERFIALGIPVNVRDSYGSTLLITACQNGNKKVAKLVLRHGADINARNHKGNTALHYCYHCTYSLIGSICFLMLPHNVHVVL